ncbi:hypothetical protein COOONC_27851 [Cooperia oncophora]
MPPWATKMIEKYLCSEWIEKALVSSLEKMIVKIVKIDEIQPSILSRLDAVEATIEAMKTSAPMSQSALYSTIALPAAPANVAVNADTGVTAPQPGPSTYKGQREAAGDEFSRVIHALWTTSVLQTKQQKTKQNG